MCGFVVPEIFPDFESLPPFHHNNEGHLECGVGVESGTGVDHGHHRNVLDAIRAREPELAATVMKHHLESARLSLTRAAST